jgi:SUMO ligase MMS21 Smc5/6 complex component
MKLGSSSHILLYTESVKNWCHYGNIVDSASHSDIGGQYSITDLKHLSLQASLETAFDSWKQKK